MELLCAGCRPDNLPMHHLIRKPLHSPHSPMLRMTYSQQNLQPEISRGKRKSSKEDCAAFPLRASLWAHCPLHSAHISRASENNDNGFASLDLLLPYKSEPYRPFPQCEGPPFVSRPVKVGIFYQGNITTWACCSLASGLAADEHLGASAGGVTPFIFIHGRRAK